MRVLTKHLRFDVKAPDDLLNYMATAVDARVRPTQRCTLPRNGEDEGGEDAAERDRLGAVITQLLERSQELHDTVDAPSVTEEAQELADIKRYLANLCAVAYAQIERGRRGAQRRTGCWVPEAATAPPGSAKRSSWAWTPNWPRTCKTRST